MKAIKLLVLGLLCNLLFGFNIALLFADNPLRVVLTTEKADYRVGEAIVFILRDKNQYTGRIGIVQADGTVKAQFTDNKNPQITLLPAFLSLPDSKIILSVHEGWTVKDKDGEIGIYPPEQRAKELIADLAARPVAHVVFDQPAKIPRTKIHLSRYQESETTLQSAIDAEIDRITARAPKWGSSNDRKSYKGSTPIETDSGLHGLRADFYNDEPQGSINGPLVRRYTIVKYYFFDENGKIFRVCSHVYGNAARFEENDRAIRGRLRFNEAK